MGRVTWGRGGWWERVCVCVGWKIQEHEPNPFNTQLSTDNWYLPFKNTWPWLISGLPFRLNSSMVLCKSFTALHPPLLLSDPPLGQRLSARKHKAKSVFVTRGSTHSSFRSRVTVQGLPQIKTWILPHWPEVLTSLLSQVQVKAPVFLAVMSVLSSAACHPVGLEHDIAICKEFKACTVLIYLIPYNISMKSWFFWYMTTLNRPMEYSMKNKCTMTAFL